jgi:stage V sporulation protein G
VEVTEVRIKLMDDPGERLQAFCSITFDDCFVIRDLKIIGGTNGPFVAMPSRKLTGHCPHCGSKNHLRAAHCNQCGGRLTERTARDEDGRAKLYADIAHPINSACREMIQQRVISAFQQELEQAKLPGYVPSYDDYDQDMEPELAEADPRTARRPAERDVGRGGRTTVEGPHQPPERPHKAPARLPATANSSIGQPAGAVTPHSGKATREGFGAGIL